jgi:hypothetical protein
MKTYWIYEEGRQVATIRAHSAVAALRRAVRNYPRHASDYSAKPGEKFMVTWRAVEPGGDWCATAQVTVPGSSDHGCLLPPPDPR